MCRRALRSATLSAAAAVRSHLPSIETSPHRSFSAIWQWRAVCNHGSLSSHSTGKRLRMDYGIVHGSRNPLATKTIDLQIIWWAVNYLGFSICSHLLANARSFWLTHGAHFYDDGNGMNPSPIDFKCFVCVCVFFFLSWSWLFVIDLSFFGRRRQLWSMTIWLSSVVLYKHCCCFYYYAGLAAGGYQSCMKPGNRKYFGFSVNLFIEFENGIFLQALLIHKAVHLVASRAVHI